MRSFKKKIKIFIINLLVSLFISTPALALDVTLGWSTWDEGLYIDHFVIYWGNRSGVYTNNTPPVMGNQTSHTITGLPNGEVYFFVMKSFDAKGNESEFSNEISTFNIQIPGDNFKANLSNYTSFTLTGTGVASTLIETFDKNSMTLLGSTTSDASGNWSITVNLSPLTEGPLVLLARQSAMEIEISGIYDIDPPSAPELLSITK
ncbi:MAG: fibronectin type III domain-containing protein [Deltaproteobacteria bacterium]|nr:fibronectin type III domain-containing protein [Deltaproteobacteria bacterium]